ncbi:MAG: hypothetical protein NT155_02555 [Candidatus Staskawiczbacteria bacterium]|nr:hypothetical protein [Candidatus Staskawiczbacteria bacterium]
MVINKQSGLPRRSSAEVGQASRLLLVLAVVILVAVVITFLIVKMAEKPPKPVTPPTTTVVEPVYEQTLGNIRFVFESAIDRGTVLKASEIVSNQYSTQKNLTVSNTGAKFIQVTVGAQNQGTKNTEPNSWTIENIVDSKGRNFVPVEGYTISPWLPNPDMCGTLLKPAFDPTPCVKIYEVSKESTGLKIKVETGKDNTGNNLSSGKIDSFLIDLIVK